MNSYLSFALKFFFAVLTVSLVDGINWQPAKRPDSLECGDLNTRLQECWGEEFISEPPSCEDKSVLLDCVETLQEQFNKCPNDFSIRKILDSTVTNYQRILKNICNSPELLNDFRHYNNCWSLAALCAKPLSVVVEGLIGPLSCRYAQEIVDMCLTAYSISFQGNSIDPKLCLESQLPDKFARLVYDSVDCRSKELTTIYECNPLITKNSVSRPESFSVITFILIKIFEFTFKK